MYSKEEKEIGKRGQKDACLLPQPKTPYLLLFVKYLTKI